MASYCSGVTMTRGLRATVGVLRPAQGCRNTTWSASAVVKIADRIVLLPAIVDADRPVVFWPAIQSRMCSGSMSIIRIAPNSGIKCLPIIDRRDRLLPQSGVRSDGALFDDDPE